MTGFSGLTPETVNQLLREVNPATGRRWTQNAIAAEFGVSRQYVSKLKHQHPSPFQDQRRIAMSAWPWSVPAELQTYWYHVLRDHLEYMATGGNEMPAWKLRQLRQFYERLDRECVVVEYDPDIGPNEVTTVGGFRLVPRDDFEARNRRIIRENRVTTLDTNGRRMWRFPPRIPSEAEGEQ